MRYLDASAAVPLYVREATSPAVERWFGAQPAGAIALSGWTLTEFSSALGIRVRTGSVSPTTARSVVADFRSLARRSLTLVPIDPSDFERASDLMLNFQLGLRAGDALHVAIAQNAGAASLVTLDKRLAGAAAQLGLAVEMPV
jgi:hypothetical protein